MWTIGNQVIKREKDFNEELLKIDGELDDLAAKITLVKFLKQNLGFTLHLLSGVELLPVQEIIIKGILSRDNSLIVASRGWGKCADENTLCLTEEGPKFLKDIRIGDNIQSTIGINKVLAKTINEKEIGLKIVLKNGLEIKIKKEHRFLILNKETLSPEYKYAKDLSIDDLIIIKSNANLWGKFEGDKDLFYYLGVVLGDGHVRENLVAITGMSIELKDFLIDFYTKRNLHFYIKEKYEKSQTWEIRIFNRKFVKYIKTFGLTTGIKAPWKPFPKEILKYKKEYIASFLSGLFDTDGHCSYHYKDKKNSHNCEIGFTSSSPDIITHVHSLLLNFGILATKRLKHKGGEFKICGVKCNTQPAHSLDFHTYKNIEIFNQQIKFRIKYKQEGVEKYLLGSKNLINNDTDIIYGLQEYLINKYKKIHFSKKYKLFTRINKTKALRYIKNNLLDESDKEKILHIINNNLHTIKIKSIEECITKTIDIQIENEECYIGNGFINHNSYLISIISILYPIFNFNSKVCIISANFRGARRIIEENEKIITSKKAKLLLQCFKVGVKSKDIVRRAPDMYKIELIQPSQSEIFALPLTPGLRGVRSSIILQDESLTITKEMQQNIIRPFLNARLNMQQEIDIRKSEDELIQLGAITEKDRISFPKNKYCMFSSASYQFEYLYELYSEMVNNIINPPQIEDPPMNFVARFSYEAIPQGTILDTTQIETAKASGDENSDYFKREYRAMFTDSSESYFNVKKLNECTTPPRDFPTTQIYGDKNSEYILSIDPSYSSNKNSDFFGMGIYLINKDERKITLVHTYGRAGGDLKEHFEYLTYLLLFFNVVMIVIDASGTEFITGYNESTLAKEKSINLKFLTGNLDVEDMVEYTKAINFTKNEYNLSARRICWAQQFSGNSISRRMNENLQNAINAKKIWFASSCKMNEAAFDKFKDFSLPYAFKDNSDQIYSLYDFIDDQDAWIPETKNQLALIEVKATSGGTMQYDLPQGLRRLKSDKRPRKDNYTCLLIAAWAARYYFDMLFCPEEAPDEMPMPILVK